MRRSLSTVLLLLPVLVGACAPASERAPGAGAQAGAGDTAVIATDPVIARALHDPLMSDPDLASRNEANAAIGFPDSHALPVLAPGPGEAQAARAALRLELLEGGLIPDLPPARGRTPQPLGPRSAPAALLAAVDAPEPCVGALAEDFARAADLPPAAGIPPGAMVVQAGAAAGTDCGVTVVRYLTPAAETDVLHYHHARARRAGLAAEHREGSIAARGDGGERLAVHVRAAANRLTGVTLVHRAPARPVRAAGRP